MVAGHRSAEPGATVALRHLGLDPLLDLGLRLGEGTGAVLALPIVAGAVRVLHEVATFDSAGVSREMTTSTRSRCAGRPPRCSSSAAARSPPGGCRRCSTPARGVDARVAGADPGAARAGRRRAGRLGARAGSSRPMWTAPGWCRWRSTTRRRPRGSARPPRSARVFCVRADDRHAATAWTPAVTRHGPVTVAVLGGGDPRRAVAVRDAIASWLAATPAVAPPAPPAGRAARAGGAGRRRPGRPGADHRQGPPAARRGRRGGRRPAGRPGCSSTSCGPTSSWSTPSKIPYGPARGPGGDQPDPGRPGAGRAVRGPAQGRRPVRLRPRRRGGDRLRRGRRTGDRRARA